VLAHLRSPIPAGIEEGVFTPSAPPGPRAIKIASDLLKFSLASILIMGIRSADGFRPRYREGLAGPRAFAAFLRRFVATNSVGWRQRRGCWKAREWARAGVREA
jgi:hypothetical protein